MTKGDGFISWKSGWKFNSKNVDIAIIDFIYDIVFHQKDPNLLLEFLVIKK